MTSVYCVIRGVTHVVDGVQVLHGIPLIEAVNLSPMEEVTAQFLAETCLQIPAFQFWGWQQLKTLGCYEEEAKVWLISSHKCDL